MTKYLYTNICESGYWFNVICDDFRMPELKRSKIISIVPSTGKLYKNKELRESSNI